MHNSRRSFLLAAASTAALGTISFRSQSQPLDAAGSRLLRIPPLIDARERGQSVSLKVQAGQTDFFPGRASATLGYNGSYLGPTLRVRKGDDVQVTVENTLAEETTVHWHGLIVPGHLDGGPHQIIRPGATWRPVLPIRQGAATLFYHSHVHGRTAEQVYGGLAGMMIISDPVERALGLPSEYGVDDLPLLIQDRLFDNGRMVLPGGMMSVMQGRRGQTLLVNGTPNALARVPAKLVRLRLVNGSNARIYHLSFNDGRPMHWIATEGGLLPTPVSLPSLSLAPGERVEILVDFSDGRPASLVTAPDANEPMMMGHMGLSRSSSTGREPLLSFEAVGSSRGEATIPTRLVSLKTPDPSKATKRRRFTLDMGMMGGMMGGGMMGGGMMGRGRSGVGAGPFGINGRGFDMSRVDERLRLGDMEIWTVSGDMMAHPFHIHGVHFQVLSRAGRAPTIRDQGLRDTVLVQEAVELLVHFTQPSGDAPFMFHCHILEHEDNGMMGQYATT